MSNFLTIPELARKYEVPERNCVRSFTDLLDRWLIMGKLREGDDWKFVPPAHPGRYKRAFRELAVVALILDSETSFCAAVRMEHIGEMRRLVPRGAVEVER